MGVDTDGQPPSESRSEQTKEGFPTLVYDRSKRGIDVSVQYERVDTTKLFAHNSHHALDFVAYTDISPDGNCAPVLTHDVLDNALCSCGIVDLVHHHRRTVFSQ
jgi:hypothetical protein